MSNTRALLIAPAGEPIWRRRTPQLDLAILMVAPPIAIAVVDLDPDEVLVGAVARDISEIFEEIILQVGEEEVAPADRRAPAMLAFGLPDLLLPGEFSLACAVKFALLSLGQDG